MKIIHACHGFHKRFHLPFSWFYFGVKMIAEMFGYYNNKIKYKYFFFYLFIHSFSID